MNPSRTPLIAGNWKMNQTLRESSDLVKALIAGLKDSQNGSRPQVMVAPPFINLRPVGELLRGHGVGLGAQNLHWESSGAFTGEVSAAMLKDAGCDYVILGHSERRRLFGDTDSGVNKKLKAALSSGLIPVVCIGETLEEREQGKTFSVLETQISGSVGGYKPEELSSLVIAYEPVWAIGTGKTATPQQAQEAHVFVRGKLGSLYGDAFKDKTRILYGGSVTAENIDSLMAQEDIDGALVGGASLKAASFLRIVHFSVPIHGSKS